MKKIDIKDNSTGPHNIEVSRFKKMVDTNLKKDPNYYKNIGAKGGKAKTSPLKNNSDRAREMARARWAKNNKKG